MKLRIAWVDSDKQMAGEYVVQERHWLMWEDLYFDIEDKKLRRDQVLGQAGISQARFADWHDAMKHALAYKANVRRIIKQVWEVE
jgi:hypothetical protein